MSVRRRQAGFSLAEVLVTAAFAPLLGALVFSFVQSSLRAARMQQALSEAQDTAHLALTLLTRDLRQAGYTPERVAIVPLARAEPASVAVRADVNGDGDCDDSAETISYREDAARRTLTRASGAAPPQPLVDHLEAGSLHFAYFGVDGARLDGGEAGLDLESRRRVGRVDARFAVAVPGAAPVQVTASVELRNADR